MRFYKNLFIIAVLIMSFGFSACSGGTTGEAGTGGTVTEDDGSGTVTEDDGVQTSMKDWKWYENKEYTIYARSSTGSSSIQEHPGIVLPFFGGTGSAADDLFRVNPVNVDMYPEDGWVLVSADFGSKEKAPVIPYFMLYNKASGTLRYVFFYAYQETYTHALVKLEQQQGHTLMFSFYDSIKCFIKDKDDNIDYDTNKSLTTVTNITPGEWNYADFVISYDPTITDTEDLCFSIKIYGVNKSDVELGGDITLNQVIGSSQKHSASISAGDVLSAGQKAVDYYKSVQEFAASSEASKGEWYSGILNAAGAAITASGPWGPVVGALAGIASSGIFGGKSSRPVPMNFKGTITLTGTITENNLIYSFLLSVPGTEISNSDSSNLSFYNKPLGIFSIESKPVVDVTVSTLSTFTPAVPGDMGSGTQAYWTFDLNVTTVKLSENSFPEIVFNSIDGFYVDTVEAGFVFSNETRTYLINRTGWESNESAPFRLHEKVDVEFFQIDLFETGSYDYYTKAGTTSTYLGAPYISPRKWYRQQIVMNDISSSTKLADVKTVASVVAPEIAIKVTMYANSDTEKKNPIIHLKRVRANYNLYWYNETTGTTTQVETTFEN